ncbi:uncharacterized protein LOC122083062 [Macadamia integrifolia]|uniref:uncharacterized protein LOC122083062 n=1 Tax=Macadamia integrifolia TaxID=60698 RepID=UPI001C4F5A25|nr:uncharacterized protein LOC122083062 [Macadamia integrifolia]
MVVSSNPNGSPSPISSRTNLNSRTQESSGIRKSFSGDPFSKPYIVQNPRGFNPVTPVNTPADFHQRKSNNGEGLVPLRVSYEQKENEKNQILKPARVKSPAVSTGTKSFMAPTVSAASKINASPRKKVLTERNEPVRTSTSFSAGKSPFTAMNLAGLPEEVRTKSETISDSKVHSEGPKKFDASLVTPVPDDLMTAANPGDDRSSIAVAFVNSKVPTKTLDFSLFSPEPRTVDSRCNDADLGSKIKTSLSPSPALAPLDMDPSLRPYDPKTNYLSPRPQFLRYKPNPRIEVYLNKERVFDSGEGKRLEERFSSESSSETENTEESQSPSPEKKYEDDGSSEMMSEEEDKNHFSVPEINTTQDQNQVLRVNKTQKSQFLSKSKSILLLVFVVACSCLPVAETPTHYPSLFKSQAFSGFDSPARIAELAKTKLDVLSHDVKLWSVRSISYLSNKLISFSNEMEEMGLLEIVNSTSSDEKHLDNDQCQTIDYVYNDRGRIQDVETVENVKEDIENIQTNVELEEQPQLIVQALDLKPEILDAGEFLEEGDLDSYNNIEPTNLEGAEKCSNAELEEQSPLLPEVGDVKADILEVGSQGENDADSRGNMEPANAEATTKSSGSDYSHGNLQSPDAHQSSLQGSIYGFPEREVLGISSIVLTLLIAALLYLRQNKASAPKAAVPQVVEQPLEQLATKKLSLCSVSASSGHLNLETPIWPAEVEKVGESGPSEMSSTFHGSSNRHEKASERASEVQSHERKPKRSAKRRESLNSASEFSAGSPSYGSFTTYEKLQSKHKSGDEEIVTPVRRSSRIKNQITSP